MTTWDEARRILAVRLDSMGDVLMTTPALRALKHGGPEGSPTHVTLLTSASGASVARLVPEVDDVIVYDAPWMKASTQRDGRVHRAFVEDLRARQFDAAAIFTVYSQNPLPAALTCQLADIPLRAAHCRENPYQLLTDWVRETEPEQGIRHEVQRQIDLASALGRRVDDQRLGLRIPDEARTHAAALLRAVEGVPWAVMHVGATALSRRYPPEHFALVARELVSEQGWSLVFSGSEDERPLVEEVRALAGVPTHSVVGAADLAGLAAIIEAAPLLISNNTGPVHLAAAVGTPVVDLYALTNPQHTPWQVPHRVLSYDVPCRWCYRSVCPEGHNDCLRRIEPSEVVRAAVDLVADRDIHLVTDTQR